MFLSECVSSLSLPVPRARFGAYLVSGTVFGNLPPVGSRITICDSLLFLFPLELTGASLEPSEFVRRPS